MQVCPQACGKTASIASRKPLSPSDEHVLDAALLQLGRHLQPEPGALARLEPEPEHVRLALGVDADRDVADPYSDGAAVPDLHAWRVDERDRVDVLERPRLPPVHIVEDGESRASRGACSTTPRPLDLPGRTEVVWYDN